MHADLSIKRLLARLETLEAEVAALRRENQQLRQENQLRCSHQDGPGLLAPLAVVRTRATTEDLRPNAPRHRTLSRSDPTGPRGTSPNQTHRLSLPTTHHSTPSGETKVLILVPLG